MITFVNYFNSFKYLKLLDDMFLARCDVFTDRLGWVPSMNNREVDSFDTYVSNPTYMIVTDENGVYQGSLRMVPTNRRNMLADVFPYVVPNGNIPNSIDIMEISRIHVVQNGNPPRKRGVNVYLGELFVGLAKYAEINDYDTMVSVVDERVLRIIRLIGVNPVLLYPEGYMQDDGINCFVVELHPKDFGPVKKFFNIESVKSIS